MEFKAAIAFLGLVIVGAIYYYIESRPVEIADLDTSLRSGTYLVYIGADNCGACRRYHGRAMNETKVQAQKSDIQFVYKVVPSLRDLRKKDVLGDFWPVFNAAGKKSRFAVPLFAVVHDGKLVDAEPGKWQKMLKIAQNAS